MTPKMTPDFREPSVSPRASSINLDFQASRNGGCPLDVIQQLLGHDNIEITAHYAQVSTRLMMEAYNGAHPHAQRTGA